MFLVDGDKISHSRNDQSALSGNFRLYQGLVNMNETSGLFSSSKKYAVVVTKTDIIYRANDNLWSEDPSIHLKPRQEVGMPEERSQDAYNIEKILYRILSKDSNFKSLINRIQNGKISAYFIAVSVDSRSRTQVVRDPETDKEQEVVKPECLNPWRFSEIFKFCH